MNNQVTVALAGNPNVGKSTVFNALTGMKQHTGNWAGKTVSNAKGEREYKGQKYVFVDLPGTYSLLAHSKEEEVARDYICFEKPDKIIVVCDATCLERNMNLVLQTLEITNNVIVCVNLLDEAKRKEIEVDLKKLSQNLGVPVVGTNASKKEGLNDLLYSLSQEHLNKKARQIRYIDPIEKEIERIKEAIEKEADININTRWLALKLIESDRSINESIKEYVSFDLLGNQNIKETVEKSKKELEKSGLTIEKIKDSIAFSIADASNEAVKDVTNYKNQKCLQRDRKIDKILTGKFTGIPAMALLLAVVFWITIFGANIPSEFLGNILFAFEDVLLKICFTLGVPGVIYEPLIFGMYRVLSWVVSVMLPPMAIFFPLFTLLEDLGYLPRIAFNLDKTFKKCCACGKQALTMCMGFGCNAVGVTGARIIDSPRERLIAILTNSFVPCNGRFPFLVSIISMFLIFSINGKLNSLYGALLLTGFVLLGILMTFVMSKVLSKTILKGTPSSFTLELPPYRKPKIGQIVVKSVLDRTVFVLGRAITAAAPAGLIIWILANITVGDITLLGHINRFLDPLGKLIGLDGVILFAFVLGLPANEIVLPIIIMSYMAQGSLTKIDDLNIIKTLLIDNGWTNVTAICTMLFSLFHWPCATTLMTVHKETKSLKWTFWSFLLPSVTGFIICFLVSNVMKLF
ncbi:MAG: ferrous iron transport protein B [Clostridia bacterium]|nr:ferrous iron transport protein B [Clostridia bacterium]